MKTGAECRPGVWGPDRRDVGPRFAARLDVDAPGAGGGGVNTKMTAQSVRGWNNQDQGSLGPRAAGWFCTVMFRFLVVCIGRLVVAARFDPRR